MKYAFNIICPCRIFVKNKIGVFISMIMKKMSNHRAMANYQTINKLFVRIKNVFSNNNKDYIKVTYYPRLGSLDLY